MSEPTTSAPAGDGTSDPAGGDPAEGEHLRDDQLFAVMHALAEAPPPAAGEDGADAELARVLGRLDVVFRQPMAPEHRLGPETLARLVAHGRACPGCRMRLLEDGPEARPPRTRAEVEDEARSAEEERRAKVRRFWTNLALGVPAFFGAQYVFGLWREKRDARTGVEDGALQLDPRDKAKGIDPLLVGAMALVLVASWFLAEAYVIARTLWIDFSAWKRAVPVIGKKWAERDKRRLGE